MAGIRQIRDNLDSPFVKVLVAAIVITFALFFGWGTVFSSSDANTVATVNGKKIDLYDLDLEMSRVQSILKQRLQDTKLKNRHSVSQQAFASLRTLTPLSLTPVLQGPLPLSVRWLIRCFGVLGAIRGELRRVPGNGGTQI